MSPLQFVAASLSVLSPQVVFEAEGAGNEHSYMALDDLHVSDGACPEPGGSMRAEHPMGTHGHRDGDSPSIHHQHQAERVLTPVSPQHPVTLSGTRVAGAALQMSACMASPGAGRVGSPWPSTPALSRTTPWAQRMVGDPQGDLVWFGGSDRSCGGMGLPVNVPSTADGVEA